MLYIYFQILSQTGIYCASLLCYLWGANVQLFVEDNETSSDDHGTKQDIQVAEKLFSKFHGGCHPAYCVWWGSSTIARYTITLYCLLFRMEGEKYFLFCKVSPLITLFLTVGRKQLIIYLYIFILVSFRLT